MVLEASPTYDDELERLLEMEFTTLGDPERIKRREI